MKKIFVMALMGMMAAGCSDGSEDMVENGLTESVVKVAVAPVRVHVNGFSVGMADFPGVQTRGTDVADYTDVNAVTLAFYSGSTEVSKITQLKDDASTYTTFGEFSLSLPMGSYTMVAVACHISASSPFALTSATEASFIGDHAFETFSALQEVTISSSAAVDVSATLERIVSKLQIVSTDGKTADVTNVRMTFAGGSKSFNPTTGLATDNNGFVNTVGNSAAVGATSSSSGFLFLTSTEEQTMDVTIQTLDQTENVIFSKTVANVPFKRNRVTILTGAMYTNPGIAGSFQVNTDWLEGANVVF